MQGAERSTSIFYVDGRFFHNTNCDKHVITNSVSYWHSECNTDLYASAETPAKEDTDAQSSTESHTKTAVLNVASAHSLSSV